MNKEKSYERKLKKFKEFEMDELKKITIQQQKAMVWQVSCRSRINRSAE